MKNFAKLPVEDRKEVFQAVAGNMGLRPDIIEKDFWVCFMLNHLFHECKYREAFVFKGGTSLSKSYHVIKRFSEDIDIILDWRKLIPENDRPWDERSKTQQDKYNKLVNKNAAIDVERTFWEKLTILNKLAFFPENKPLPSRYARHLYDVYCMANSQVKEAAFARKELLEKDIAFKQKFYYAKGAHYETATLAEISLIPAEYIMDDVKSDYVAMKNMIYGEYPYFDDIIDCLTKLETEVHALS